MPEKHIYTYIGSVKLSVYECIFANITGILPDSDRKIPIKVKNYAIASHRSFP